GGQGEARDRRRGGWSRHRAAAGKSQGPVRADRAREHSVLVALGSRDGSSSDATASEFPYEDATSTEARLRLSNGSPPFRGHHLREDPTSPDRRAARARVVRARGVARANASNECAVFARRVSTTRV